MDKYKVLKEVFGHSDFREGQEQIVDAILSGRDIMGIMPTGAGESVCYQLPALMLDGIPIVISPLIIFANAYAFKNSFCFSMSLASVSSLCHPVMGNNSQYFFIPLYSLNSVNIGYLGTVLKFIQKCYNNAN